MKKKEMGKNLKTPMTFLTEQLKQPEKRNCSC